MENILNKLILSLNKEEARHFKLYANKYDANSEGRKDLLLFDYVRKQADRYNEEKIFSSLYDEADKNSFYRLRNRLSEEIGKSLLQLHYSEGDYNFILNHILLCRLFQQKRNYDLALYYLRKGERKAKQIQSHELLDMIYGEAVRISNESLEVNPEEYIQLRKENREILQQLQEIDDVLAVLIYRIKVSQNFTSGNYEITTLLTNTIAEYSEKKETKNNPVFRAKAYHAVSRILLQQHDYRSLAKYLIKTYREFSQDHLFTRNNHDTKLQMLTYLANAMFKTGKHKESLAYADELKISMEEYGAFLREKYLFYYYNILVNNYGEIDKQKAVTTLLEAQNKREIAANKFNQSFIWLQLALQYFDLREFRNANKNMVKVKLEDNFRIFDAAFQLKILIVELIIRNEMEDDDFVELQIPKIKKEYNELLSKENYRRQQFMLDFLKQLIAKSGTRREKKLLSLSVELLSAKEEEESNDLIHYNEWIKRKMVKNRIN